MYFLIEKIVFICNIYIYIDDYENESLLSTVFCCYEAGFHQFINILVKSGVHHLHFCFLLDPNFPILNNAKTDAVLV
jgi:hypothetical protein